MAERPDSLLLPIPYATRDRVNQLLDHYGALIGPDFEALGVTLQAMDATTLLRPVDTLLGTLYFPQDPYTSSKLPYPQGQSPRRIPRRSHSSAINAAYVRLFMSRQTDWTVTDPRLVGVLTAKATDQLPAREQYGQRLLLTGKVLGGGISPDYLLRLARSIRLPFTNGNLKLLVIAPEITRFARFAERYREVLHLEQFTPEEARRLNTPSEHIPPRNHVQTEKTT